MKMPMMIAVALCAVTGPAAAASQASVPAAVEAACAAEDMQLAYHWLAPELAPAARAKATSCHPGRKSLEIPGWLEKARPALLEKKVLKDPEEGELSEAWLWQDAFSILYELADTVAKKALPSSPGRLSGTGLRAALSDIRPRLIMTSDRLYRSGLGGSLEGRGGAVLAAVDGVLASLDAAGAGDGKDAGAVNAELGRTLGAVRAVFAALNGPVPPGGAPPRYEPKAALLPGYRGVSLALSGSQVMFLSPGDRVDMLVTFDAVMTGDRQEKITATILQNVIALRVDKPAEPGGTGVVQLLCNPNEAQYAALSLAQGSISLVRRAKGDAELHPMEIASFRKVFK